MHPMISVDVAAQRRQDLLRRAELDRVARSVRDAQRRERAPHAVFGWARGLLAAGRVRHSVRHTSAAVCHEVLAAAAARGGRPHAPSSGA